MWQDPIVNEVRKIRHEIESQYISDEAYFTHLKKLQEQYKGRLIRKPHQDKQTPNFRDEKVFGNTQC